MPDLGARKRVDTDVLLSEALARIDAQNQVTEHEPVRDHVPTFDLRKENEKLWNLLKTAIRAGCVVQTRPQDAD